MVQPNKLGLLRMMANKLKGVADGAPIEQITTINENAIKKAAETLTKYKAGKTNLEKRIVEEEQWWKIRHWDVIGKDETKKNRPQPASAWLFNSLSNKHADMMDNYPEANVLPREQSDEQSAKILSSILPVVFERNNYEETYSDAAWYKLKHGVVAKGVFWNTELEDGLGDIDTQFIDLLNIFWEPGITDIQSSRNLFIVSLKDNDLIEAQYPQLKGKGSKVIDVQEYVYDDTVDTSNKSLVVDWYYKKANSQGKTVVHLCKFVGNTILFASENQPEYAENGFYNHGQYPVVFDVLFPEEGTPVGFGYISIMKSPQMYIDKLQQVILENAIRATKPRYFAKKNLGINVDEFRDETQDIVYVDGGEINDERLRPIEVQQVSGSVMNILQMKIDELKETSSNRDFSQGSTASGVTSGAAISALQEAGNKQSRDMISATYRSYTRECYLALELMRQFYDETRTFRIIGDEGKYKYVQFSNRMMQGQPIPTAYEGQELEPDYVQLFRKPVYDIVIKPQKRSPYSKMAQNELAKEMYNMGFFNPQLAEQSMTALELMDFDGIETVKEKVQTGQTLFNMVQQMSQELAMLKSAFGMGMPQAQNGGVAVPNVPQGASMAKAQKNAQMATMTPYGARLASRANPDMNTQ